MLFAVIEDINSVPEVPLLPDQSTLAVQLVAFELLQDKVVDSPLVMLEGLAVIVMLGNGRLKVTDTESFVDPPLPVQFKL